MNLSGEKDKEMKTYCALAWPERLREAFREGERPLEREREGFRERERA